MEQIIRDMIKQAETEKDYTLLEYVQKLIWELADTINCPSNWRSIGEELAKEYESDSWVYEELALWDYAESEGE